MLVRGAPAAGHFWGWGDLKNLFERTRLVEREWACKNHFLFSTRARAQSGPFEPRPVIYPEGTHFMWDGGGGSLVMRKTLRSIRTPRLAPRLLHPSGVPASGYSGGGARSTGTPKFLGWESAVGSAEMSRNATCDMERGSLRVWLPARAPPPLIPLPSSPPGPITPPCARARPTTPPPPRRKRRKKCHFRRHPR